MTAAAAEPTAAAAETAPNPDGEASPTLPPPPPPARTGRLLGLSALMGALAAGSFVAGLCAREAEGRRVSVLVVAIGLLLGLKLALDRVARWALPSQGVVVTSLAAAGLGPLFTAGALAAAADPIVASSWRCGTGERMLLLYAPFGFFLFGALGTLVAAGVLGGGRGEAFRPLIRIAAIFATIVAGWLVLLGLVRSTRAPDIDHYLESLPITATLVPLAAPPASDRRTQVEPESGDGAEAVPSAAHPDLVADFVVYRACKHDLCGIAIGNAGRVREALTPRETLGRDVAASAQLTVRSDEVHRFVLIEGINRWAYRRPPAWRGEFDDAPDADTSQLPPVLWPLTDIYPRDVAGAASPPRAWLLGGLAGLLAACGLLLESFRRARRLRARLAGTPGILGASGWISFEGERPPARVDPGAGLAPGPVLVAEDGTGHSGAYRGDGLLSAARVVSGTRKEWTERHEARAAELHAWAIATAALGVAPLAAAAIVGLVW